MNRLTRLVGLGSLLLGATLGKVSYDSASAPVPQKNVAFEQVVSQKNGVVQKVIPQKSVRFAPFYEQFGDRAYDFFDVLDTQRNTPYAATVYSDGVRVFGGNLFSSFGKKEVISVTQKEPLAQKSNFVYVSSLEDKLESSSVSASSTSDTVVSWNIVQNDGGNHQALVSITNANPGAVFNSATIPFVEQFSTILNYALEHNQSLKNLGITTVSQLFQSGLIGISIDTGSNPIYVNQGWSANINPSTGILHLTNNGLDPDLDYEVWRSSTDGNPHTMQLTYRFGNTNNPDPRLKNILDLNGDGIVQSRERIVVHENPISTPVFVATTVGNFQIVTPLPVYKIEDPTQPQPTQRFALPFTSLSIDTPQLARYGFPTSQIQSDLASNMTDVLFAQKDTSHQDFVFSDGLQFFGGNMFDATAQNPFPLTTQTGQNDAVFIVGGKITHYDLSSQTQRPIVVISDNTLSHYQIFQSGSKTQVFATITNQNQNAQFDSFTIPIGLSTYEVISYIIKHNPALREAGVHSPETLFASPYFQYAIDPTSEVKQGWSASLDAKTGIVTLAHAPTQYEQWQDQDTNPLKDSVKVVFEFGNPSATDSCLRNLLDFNSDNFMQSGEYLALQEDMHINPVGNGLGAGLLSHPTLGFVKPMYTAGFSMFKPQNPISTQSMQVLSAQEACDCMKFKPQLSDLAQTQFNLGYFSTPNIRYQLRTSSDLVNWTPLNDLRLETEPRYIVEKVLTNKPRSFFQYNITP
jgi:hypothetical protein